MRSLKHLMKYFNFRYKVWLDHPVHGVPASRNLNCHEIYFGGPVLLTNALKHSVPMTHLDCVCVCPLPTLACRHHSIQIQYRKSGWKEGRTNWEWWGSERERDHLTKKYYFFKALGKLSYFRVIYWRKYHNHLVAGSFLYHFVNAPSGSRFEG